MARFTNNLQPSSFTSDWKYNYEINSNYSLRNASDLFEVNCKNNYLKMHPWINFVRKWNNFKDDIKYISHIPTFKKKLKNKMISHINGEICVDVLCFACHGVSSTIALKD